MSDLRISPSVSVPGMAMEFTVATSGGPGGQHVNTTHTKVLLRVQVAQIIGLDFFAQQRLAKLAGQRLTAAGELLLESEQTRSQARNRDLVIARLVDLIREAMVRPKVRRPTKPSRGSKERRLEAKRHTGEKKRDRRAGD